MNQNSLPSVSIVIPTFNGERTIGTLLDRILSQSHPPEQIVVIDSSSTDRTVSEVRARGIEPLIIERSEFNHGRTRNLGARMTDSEVVVFMTQDAVPCSNLLIENLLQGFVDPKVAGAYGRQITSEDAPLLERFLRGFNYPPVRLTKRLPMTVSMGIKTFFFSNVCSAVRRDVFFDVGGFPEVLPLNEDMALAYRILKKGYSIIYEPDATVYHTHRFSLYERCLRYYRIGLSVGLMQIHREVGCSSEGIRYLKEGIRFFFRMGRPHYIFYFFLDTLLRSVAFQLGLMRGASRSNGEAERVEEVPGVFKQSKENQRFSGV